MIWIWRHWKWKLFGHCDAFHKIDDKSWYCIKSARPHDFHMDSKGYFW